MPKLINVPCISSIGQCKLAFNQNQITKIIEGSTYDDATSPKGRMTFDDITNLVELSTESQLGKSPM
jgi:hypothetical protein